MTIIDAGLAVMKDPSTTTRSSSTTDTHTDTDIDIDTTTSMKGMTATEEDLNTIFRPVQIPRVKVPVNIPSGTVLVTPMGGKIKAPPICRIPSLRKEHMTSDQMSKWCFSPNDVWTTQQHQGQHQGQQQGQGVEEEEQKMEQEESSGETYHAISPREWQLHKKNILNQNESRNGRETQRFATDAQTGQLLRLTTGCVPIMNDGKILLVSSSRKGEWILPKGGWESDESMQVSALRETYEEGGILGVIGPKLNGIDFEKAKVKKRRLELESLKKKYEIACGNAVQSQQQSQPQDTPVSSTVSVQSNASSQQYQSEDDQMQANSNSGSNSNSSYTHQNSNESQTSTSTSTNDANAKSSSISTSPNGKDCLATKIRNELIQSQNIFEKHDDSASIASSELSSSCTHVRLCMFPLYVLEVREHWPESGRARRVVDIDKAIDIMSSRPEFHQALVEVKRKGFHLKPYHHHDQMLDGMSSSHYNNVKTTIGGEGVEVEAVLSSDNESKI